MKKALLICLLLALLHALPASAQEERIDPAFDAFLSSAYGDWTVLDCSVCAPSAAAILEKDGRKTLLIARQQAGQWTAAIDNPRMVSSGMWRHSVHMDTDTTLFFSCLSERPNDLSLTLDFALDQETWRLRSVKGSYQFPVGPERTPAILERQTDVPFSGQWLLRSMALCDENDNLLISRALPPLRNILTKEETDLANLDILALPFDVYGYASEDDGRVLDTYLTRLFGREIGAGSAYAGYRYLDGLLTDETLQFIAEGPEGQSVLLCGRWEEDAGWVFTKSSPLSAAAQFGYENFGDAVVLPGRDLGVCVRPYPDGKWGISYVLSGAGYYEAGPGWIEAPDESGIVFAPVLGDHPWGDVTAMDWMSIPASFDEAAALADPAAWATPKNPDSSQRLHLRREPSKAARSLGKHYHGAPVRVLEKGKKWSKVRAGSQEGYMMNEFLVFGKELRKLSPLLARKEAARPVTFVTWHDSGETEKLFPEEVRCLIVIGLILFRV